MKPTLDRRRRTAGLMLIQVLVYLAATALILSLASVAIFDALGRVRRDLELAQRAGLLLDAGERWRDDVRASSGNVVVETTEQGSVCRMGAGTNTVLWTLSRGELSRAAGEGAPSKVWARGVAEAVFLCEERGEVRPWRMDATLAKVRKTERHPVAFTFRSVPRQEVAR